MLLAPIPRSSVGTTLHLYFISFYVKFGGDFTFTVTNTAIRPLRRHFKCINPAKCCNLHERVELAESNDNGPPLFPDCFKSSYPKKILIEKKTLY